MLGYDNSQLVMDKSGELERQSSQLSAAIKSLLDSHQRMQLGSPERTSAVTEDVEDLNKIKARILASLSGIKALVGGPADLVQDLARQVELVACLQWLAEFQILACIPMEGSVTIENVAELAGVPHDHLLRVVRLTATHGVLQEPIPGFICHTTLSAEFVNNQPMLDAVMFMAESSVPAALQMAPATQRFGASLSPTQSAYNLAFNTVKSFHMHRKERSKLNRQWCAYLRYAAGLRQDEELVDMLSRLHWSNLGNALVVEVGAQSKSLAQRLGGAFPELRLVIQINTTDDGVQLSHGDPDLGDPDLMSSSIDSRINVTYRTPGMPQPVMDAAVYIVHLPVERPTLLPGTGRGLALWDAVRSQLHDYISVLRTGGGVLLILTSRLLPEPGSLSNPELEAVARARDLNMLHLTNEGEMEISDLLNIIDTVGDNAGKLVVANELRSHTGLILALVVKHQPY